MITHITSGYEESSWPPLMSEAWIEGGPTRGCGGRAIRSRPSCSSATRTRPMWAIASTPSRKRLPCAARPWVTISAQTNPLCATPTSRLVCSSTSAASGRQRSISRQIACVPMLAYSSSTTKVATSRPGKSPARATSSSSVIMAASAFFMSLEPRPWSRPSSRRGAKGAFIPTTPTVSVWPLSIRVRPGPSPTLAITLGRPPPASCSSTMIPSVRRSRAAIASAIFRSPSAPGTRSGLIDGMRISSASASVNRSRVSSIMGVRPPSRSVAFRPVRPHARARYHAPQVPRRSARRRPSRRVGISIVHCPRSGYGSPTLRIPRPPARPASRGRSYSSSA